MRDALELLIHAAGEVRAREILSEVARPAAQAEFERLAAVLLAARMLSLRAPRSEIRDRLVRRGMSVRSAYRVIDLALDLGPPIGCANPPLVLAQPEAMLQAPTDPQPEELNHMATVDELKRNRDDLRARLEKIPPENDLQQAVKHAEEQFEAVRKLGTAKEMEARGWQVDDYRRESGAAWEGLKAARARLTSAKAERPQLEAEIERLSAMIEGGPRLDDAKRRASDSRQQVIEAEAAVAAAEAAIRRIDEMLVEEERTIDESRTASAAQILAAVKAGGTPGAAPTTSRDGIATLQLARQSAEAELAAARGKLKQAQDARSVAVRAVQIAEAAITERKFEEARAAFVDALTEHTVAHVMAHRSGYAAADPRPEAMARAARQLERQGY